MQSNKLVIIYLAPDKGITFKPNPGALDHLECFVDADFAGNYCKEMQHDLVSVKSRTGCVIKYAGCPIHWFSCLQSEIALSTTEAEYIALSIAARELLPMRELQGKRGKVKSLRKSRTLS